MTPAALLRLLLMMMGLLGQPGRAQAPEETVLTGLPAQTFTGLNGLAARNETWPWGQAQVEALKPVLLWDDVVDEHERRLLGELTKPAFHLRIVATPQPGFAPADIVLRGHFTEEARRTLADLRPPEGRERLGLWLQTGGAGWTKLVHHTARGPAEREEVVEVIRESLAGAWATATPQTRYLTFRQMLSGLESTAALAEDKQVHTEARALLHAACERLAASSQTAGRTLPPFLYRWLRPPQADPAGQ